MKKLIGILIVISILFATIPTSVLAQTEVGFDEQELPQYAIDHAKKLNADVKLVERVVSESGDGGTIVETTYEYIPKNATEKANTASGTCELTTNFSDDHGGVLRGSITLYATFDWNKDNKTVYRYNDGYTIDKNTLTIDKLPYIRNIERSFPSYEETFYNAFSRSIKVTFNYGSVDGSFKIVKELRCFADGGYRIT